MADDLNVRREGNLVHGIVKGKAGEQFEPEDEDDAERDEGKDEAAEGDPVLAAAGIDGLMLGEGTAAAHCGPADKRPHDERGNKKSDGHGPGEMGDAVRGGTLRVERGLRILATGEEQSQGNEKDKSPHGNLH